MTYLQKETELTRQTLFDILLQCDRLNDFIINPQIFCTEVTKLMNRALHELAIEGIEYHKIDNEVYEMRLFENNQIQEYLSRLYPIQSYQNKSPYDYVPYDSEVEKEIAEGLDNNGNVKFFCKLPRWFVIQTPIGEYNPDWALVTNGDKKLYLVRETKSSHDSNKRRPSENQKIACGKAHFTELGVDFKVAISADEVIS